MKVEARSLKISQNSSLYDSFLQNYNNMNIGNIYHALVKRKKLMFVKMHKTNFQNFRDTRNRDFQKCKTNRDL